MSRSSGLDSDKEISPKSTMVASEEFSQALRPLLLYLKKMELELTCPKCANLLSVPILLPCNHMFCSQCIRTKDNYQYDCLACPSSYAIKDLRHSALTQAFVDIFKSMDAAIAAIVQKLGPQVDISGVNSPSNDTRFVKNTSTEGAMVPSNGHSIFDSNQSELPMKDSQVDLSEHGIIKEKTQQCEVDVSDLKMFSKEFYVSVLNDTAEKSQGCLVTASGLKSTSKEIPLLDCNGSDKKFQGAKMPQKETPVSSTNSTNETLQEHLACKVPGGKSVYIVYTRRPRDGGQRSKLANLGSKNSIEHAEKTSFHNQGKQDIHPCDYTKDSETDYNHQGNGHSTKNSSMNVSQNKDVEAETKGKIEVALLAHTDQLTCKRQHSEKSNHASSCGTSSQLVACNVRKAKRHRLNCAHKSNPDSQLISTSCKLPKMETEEKIVAKTSSSPIEHSASLGNPTLEQQFPDLWSAAFDNCNEWHLCGSDLSNLQEKFLDEFVSLSGASLTKTWKKDTTHVIVSTDEQGTCRSTKKVLMAILSGQWVVKFDWIKACKKAKRPVPEETYEICQISLQARVGVGSSGPKKGRFRVMKKAPKIFSGLSFYFGDQFMAFDRTYLEDLVVAAGGIVLKKRNMKSQESVRKVLSSGPGYIVYSEDLPTTCSPRDLLEIGSKRCDEAASLAAKTGLMVIGHFRLLDAIATCSSSDELMKGAIK